MNELIWWVVSKDGQQYICTLPDTRGAQPVGAHAAHGPFVPFPFSVLRPASQDEIEWAEEQLDLSISAREREAEDRRSLE